MAEVAEVPEEVTEELDLEEGTPPAAPPEETAPAPAGMELTIEQLPELAGLAQGDTITLEIQGVSDDGNTFTVGVMGETEPAGAEGAGRAAVEQELLGTPPPVE